MPPATCMAATATITTMMNATTVRGRSSSETVAPVRPSSRTPRPPANPMPMPPTLAPIAMAPSRMSRWSQIIAATPWLLRAAAGSGWERGWWDGGARGRPSGCRTTRVISFDGGVETP